jgi:hypothetical protein
MGLSQSLLFWHTEQFARLELEPILVLLVIDNSVKFSVTVSWVGVQLGRIFIRCRIVPLIQVLEADVNPSTIRIIPSDLRQ